MMCQIFWYDIFRLTTIIEYLDPIIHKSYIRRNILDRFHKIHKTIWWLIWTLDLDVCGSSHQSCTLSDLSILSNLIFDSLLTWDLATKTGLIEMLKQCRAWRLIFWTSLPSLLIFLTGIFEQQTFHHFLRYPKLKNWSARILYGR